MRCRKIVQNRHYRVFSKGGHHDKKVDKISNEMLEDEHELVTMSITNSAKAILIFKKI